MEKVAYTEALSEGRVTHLIHVHFDLTIDELWAVVLRRQGSKLKGPGHVLIDHMIKCPGFFQSVPEDNKDAFAAWVIEDDVDQWGDTLYNSDTKSLQICPAYYGGSTLPEWIVEHARSSEAGRFWLARKFLFENANEKMERLDFPSSVTADLVYAAILEKLILEKPFVSCSMDKIEESAKNKELWAYMPQMMFITLANVYGMPTDEHKAWALRETLEKQHIFRLLHWKVQLEVVDTVVSVSALEGQPVIALQGVKNWLSGWQTHGRKPVDAKKAETLAMLDALIASE